MHPIIAFLSFIFSPANDWLLKQSFELLIDPAQIPAAVESYDRIGKVYPSQVTDEWGERYSADTLASALWAEILGSRGHHRAALDLLTRLDQDPLLAPELVDIVKLRIGESSLNQGDLASAEETFLKILENPSSPRVLDAQINLLVCDLAKHDIVSATEKADLLIEFLGPEVHLSKGLFPLGLTFFAAQSYEKAVTYLSLMEDDPRARYFLGLAYRHLEKPHHALAQWQNLKKPGVEPFWRSLADFQVAETYFSLGDDDLSRLACEKALSDNPVGSLRDKLQFRLAAIDIRHNNYEAALARLAPLLDNQELSGRSSILMAESMVKTNQSKDLLSMLTRRNKRGTSAESTYQMAWVALYEKNNERALAEAEKGLKNFFDADFTPRLLLLQGLAYEHLGHEAEALATFQTISDRFPDTEAAALSAHWTLLAYMRMGRWKEAVTHGSYMWNQLSMESKKAHPETAFWLAEAHLKLKRFEDSDRLFEKFVNLAAVDHPLTLNAHFERSVALGNLNKLQEALASLHRFSILAKEKGDNNLLTLAHLQQGHLYFNNKQYAQAVANYRFAERSPKSSFYEGLALYRLDYFSDAVDVWTKLASDFPKDELAETALFRSARTQFELGAATQSVATFAKFIKTYPDSPVVKEARLQSAHALYNSGDPAGAAPLYADYLARYHTPDDLTNVTPYLASCYVQLGKTTRETAELMKGLPPAPSVAALQWNEGAKEYNDKNYEAASEIFASLLTTFPSHENSETALFFRGESLFLQQKWADAEGAFHHFLNLYPESNPDHASLALFHQGVAIYNQDRLLEAGEVFLAYMNRFPDKALASDALDNLYLCYHNLGNWEKAEELKKKFSAVVLKLQESDGRLANSNVTWGSR